MDDPVLFYIADKWEQSVLIVDEANDISYCVGNKGKNHAARFRSPNGLVSILESQINDCPY